MNRMKTQKLLKKRRGISAVISNLILIGAVIAVGFTVVVWSQNQSSNYNNLYGNAIKSDADQLRERLAFEYISYDNSGKILRVFLLNSGTIGNVSIANVYVNSTSYGAPTLYLLSSGIQTSSLSATQEGYFSISPSLAPGRNYPIVIVTGRGSSFVATFAT